MTEREPTVNQPEAVERSSSPYGSRRASFRRILGSALIFGIIGTGIVAAKQENDAKIASEKKHDDLIEKVKVEVADVLTNKANWTAINPGETNNKADGTPSLYPVVYNVFHDDGIGDPKAGDNHWGGSFMDEEGYYAFEEQPGECDQIEFNAWESGIGPNLKYMHLSNDIGAVTLIYETRTLEVCNNSKIESNITVIQAPAGSLYASQG